jgi:thiamine biosynthesis lipoprotein
MLSGTASARNPGEKPLRRGAGLSAVGHWHAREETIMGTSVKVELWCPDRLQAQAAIDAVMAEMHRIDAAMSPHKPDSELSRINRDAASTAVALSEEMTRLLARAIGFSELSNGAFDITYASAGQLYDYRVGIRPSDDALEQARAAIGYRHLQLDTNAGRLRFGREGVRIDLGGFAKGHAVDNGVAILAKHGIAHAVVSAGGDSHVLGDRRGRPWMIGIRDPRRVGEVVAVMPLEDAALSTSGDYERFFEREGQRFHHLIDPKTGRSPQGVHSVTIVADDGLTTEALSKCVFVMGLHDGMRFIESQPGVDAVVVDAAGALHYSSGLLSGQARPAQQEITT